MKKRFICPRCLYDERIKCNLKKNLSRKDTCRPNYSIMGPKLILFLVDTNYDALLLDVVSTAWTISGS